LLFIFSVAHVLNYNAKLPNADFTATSGLKKVLVDYPHKDKEVSQMRMTCFKKFFHIPQELAQVKEEYSRFSSCSEEFNDPGSIYDRWVVSPMTWWTIMDNLSLY